MASTSNDKTVHVWDRAMGAVRQMFEGYTSHITKLSFGEDTHLQTDQELLCIQPNSADSFTPKRWTQRTISVKGDWITQDDGDILWLPPDYRPSCSAFQDNILVLGCAFGEVAFIKFSPLAES